MENDKMKVFEDRKIRTTWDEEKEEWYFSVMDVVAVLTDSVDPKQYIKKMRRRDPELNSKWGTNCTPVQMIATDENKILPYKKGNPTGLPFYFLKSGISNTLIIQLAFRHTIRQTPED